MTLKQGIHPEELYQLKSVADPQVSPDGTEVVYIATHIDEKKKDYVSNLFYIDLNEKSLNNGHLVKIKRVRLYGHQMAVKLHLYQRERVSHKFLCFQKQVGKRNNLLIVKTVRHRLLGLRVVKHRILSKVR